MRLGFILTNIEVKVFWAVTGTGLGCLIEPLVVLWVLFDAYAKNVRGLWFKHLYRYSTSCMGDTLARASGVLKKFCV